jgi:glycine/D-amino acid oxidase-like deaminating enzyme
MPGYGARYWAERTAESRRRSYPKLKGPHTADVVVIGGGLTGAATAYSLAAGGLNVILVEADRIAGGSTAGSLGAILPEPDAMYRPSEQAAGKFAARSAFHEAQKGAGDLARVLGRLKIKCDLEPAPYFVHAATPEQLEAAKKDQAIRRAGGVPVTWSTPKVVRSETALETLGGLKMTPGFVYDPVRAALGFASAAEAAGAKVFEHSTVRKTIFTRKYADVLLKDATIRTTGIVVATGEPGTVFGQLRRHVRRASGFVVVTEPLPAAMRRETGKRTAIVTEATANGRPWLRWLPDGRAMFGGAVTPAPPSRLIDRMRVQKTAQLMYELSVRYPVISGLPARWGWETEVVTTMDGLPWIGPHRNYPFHFFAMGFGWHGDSLAWAAARAALRHFKGEATRSDAALGFARYL